MSYKEWPSAIVPTTERLKPENQASLEKLARLTNRPKSYLINRAVEAYTKEKSAYLTDLDEVVESIDTKPTYKAGDVFFWMGTWDTEDEKPFSKAVPPCRK